MDKNLTQMMTCAFIFCAVMFSLYMDAQHSSINDSSQITCYSGGNLILNDYSTGKINNSDGYGYGYKSATTGHYVNTKGDCRVTYGVEKPADFKMIGI